MLGCCKPLFFCGDGEPSPRYIWCSPCGYRIGLRPMGGACPLRPLRLLRLSVSAAGGGHLRSKLFSSPLVHGNSSFLKNIQ